MAESTRCAMNLDITQLDYHESIWFRPFGVDFG